jgi:hypothetical protein
MCLGRETVRCEEFEIRLNDIVDERRMPESDPELCAHAAGCGSCEQLLRGYETLLDSVAHLEKVEAAPELCYRVMAEWQSVPHARAHRRVRVELALAATLLVAALPALLWLRSRSSPPAAAPRAAHDAQVASAATVTGFRPALVDEAREAYEPLLVAAGKSLFEALGSFPSEDAPDEDAAGAEPSRDEERTVFGDMGPVAESATRSVVALFRILPGTATSFEARGMNQ